MEGNRRNVLNFRCSRWERLFPKEVVVFSSLPISILDRGEKGKTKKTPFFLSVSWRRQNDCAVLPSSFVGNTQRRDDAPIFSLATFFKPKINRPCVENECAAALHICSLSETPMHFFALRICVCFLRNIRIRTYVHNSLESYCSYVGL